MKSAVCHTPTSLKMSAVIQRPLIPHPEDESEEIYNSERYELLRANVQEMLEQDCWGMKIGDEILFDNYDDTRSWSQIIQHELVRDKLADNIHSVFVWLKRRRHYSPVPTNIHIYMFQVEVHVARITYYPTEDEFHITHHLLADS